MSLVHAFLHTHTPKLAPKFASKYPNLALEDQAGNADALSNALVSLVKTAVSVPKSELSVLLRTDDEEEEEAEDRVKERKMPKEKKDKKEKKEKKGKKKKSEEAEAKNKPEEVDANVSIPAPAAPEAVVEETMEVEVPAPQPKKKGPVQGQRFQRVKSENVVFLDERLKDMSYDAKSGAGDWGAKASADLIVTRGKAFTKEKNKKKRGSYRGGLIDQGSQYVYTRTNTLALSNLHTTMKSECGHSLIPIAKASSHIPISKRVDVSQMICSLFICSTVGEN